MMTPKDIRAIRLRLHLTQAQMAEELGCSRVHISNLERGLYGVGHKFRAQIQLLGAQANPCPACKGTGFQEISSTSSCS